MEASSNGKKERGAESKSGFILEDLARILSAIEQSTMGTESEDDFDHLFEDLALTSTKLGRTEKDNSFTDPKSPFKITQKK